MTQAEPTGGSTTPRAWQTRVEVVLCEEALGPEPNPDAGWLRDLVEAACGRRVSVEVVPGICRHPRLLTSLASRPQPSHLVIGVCRTSAAEPEYSLWAGRIGLDPFAVELVTLELGASASPDDPRSRQAARLIAAAAAKTLALRPDGRRRTAVAAGRVGRRALLSALALTDRPVAAPLPDVCAGTRRCGLCVGVCRAGAISTGDDLPSVDPVRCTGCGDCVTVCPVAAMSLPGASIAQYEAQLGVLLAGGGRDILLACNAAALPEGIGRIGPESGRAWSLVRVPCISMVTPGWVLQIVASGGTVALLPCGGDCIGVWGDPERGRAAYCRLALEVCGEREAARRVRILTGCADETLEGLAAPEPEGASDPGHVVLSEPTSTAIALLRIAASRDANQLARITHPESPLGLLRVHRDLCTVCGACATVCPTSALKFDQDQDCARLSYDAARCLPCGRCVSSCPEGALDVRSETALDALAFGEVEVARSALSRCRRCGSPLVPLATAARVRDLLGSPSRDGDLCPTCAISLRVG